MDISKLLGTINDVWGSGQTVDKYGVAVEVRYDQYRGNFAVTITDGSQSTQHPLYVYYQSNMGSLVEQFNVAIKTAIDNHKGLVYKETMTSEEVPLFTEAVVGYRRWILADWVLSPTNYGSPWRPGVNTAKCQPDTHRQLRGHPLMRDQPGHSEAPAEGCNCGLNAFFDPPFQGNANRDRLAEGAIVGWGRMQVHPDGFRAQYAQIVGLLNAPTEVAGVYGVETFEDMESLQVHASKFGSPLPENLRPAEQEPERRRGLGSYYTQAYYPTLSAYTGTSTNTALRYSELVKAYEYAKKKELEREKEARRNRWPW